jgi:hypothetical protein
MRRVGGVVTAMLLAATYISVVESAAADFVPYKAPIAGTKENFDRFLLSGGVDLARHGGSIYGGMLWSPNGLAREGFTLKLLVAGGQYRYQGDGSEIDGRYGLLSAMAGWRIKRDRLEVTVFTGPDVQSHGLTPDDPQNKLRGGNFGIRFGGDLWYQPSDAFMATGSVSVSSIGPNFWSRGAVGWYLFERAWIGPEVMALGGDRYRQFRLGVHATSFRTKEFEWSGGFGYARDSENRNGAYVRIGVLTRR